MGRCVIIGGAPVENYNEVRKYLKHDDYNIFCDSGLKHASDLKITPDLIVGDFDSWIPETGFEIKLGTLNSDLNFRNVDGQIKNSDQLLKNNMRSRDSEPDRSYIGCEPEILVIPHEKFDTDTVYGVREGIDRGFNDFLLVGCLGKKMYHSLGNLYILVMLESQGKHGLIVDDYSDMEIVSDKPGYISDSYSGFSLLNITGTAKGIKIDNARYTYLPKGEITCDYQYGLSNEVIPGKTAKVTVSEGMLLLIRDRV